MPRIRLKHKSPEYADSSDNSGQPAENCDMPGCPRAAEHKAPKDRALSAYYHFCTEHVREYNTAWDFFSGMHPDEVQEHILNAAYGERPTWRYDLEGAAEEILRQKAGRMYGAHHHEQTRNQANGAGGQNGYGGRAQGNGHDHFGNTGAEQDRHGGNNNRNSRALPGGDFAEVEALSIMGLAPPLTLEDIRSRYRVLVKKHHPDINQGDPAAEDLLKKINMAYTILKLAYEKFEKLPQEI